MLYSVLTYFLVWFHPFYVSVTEINHNAREKNLEVSIRIFYDDLEQTLEKQAKTNVDILKPSDKNQMNILIGNYLKTHFKINVNGQQVPVKFLGYQIEEDAAWCFLEVPGTAQVKQLMVQNDVLYELHREQTNLVHATVNGKRQSTKLDNPVSKWNFTF